MSRQIAPFLEQELGVPVNVVNATGGAGVTGHSRGSRARPDGYTLTMMTVELNMLHWRELTDISWEDFEVIGMINSDAAAILIRSDDTERWPDPRQLIAYIRENPGQLRASGTATGGIWHLALAGWLEDEGLSPADIKWIPMNGSGPSLQELVSGGVDLVCCSLPEARTLLEAGEVQGIGVMANKRVTGYEDVPTFQEFGITWTSPAWRGLGLPKGTPSRIVERYTEVIPRILRGDVVVGGVAFPDLMARQGFDVTWQPPQDFEQTLVRLDRELGRLLTGSAFSEVESGPVAPFEIPSILLGIGAISLILLIFREREGIRRLSLKGRGMSVLKIAESVLAVGIYLLVAETLGFVLTATVLLFLLFLRSGVALRVSLPIAVLLVPVLYQIFSVALKVPLPRGVLGW